MASFVHSYCKARGRNKSRIILLDEFYVIISNAAVKASVTITFIEQSMVITCNYFNLCNADTSSCFFFVIRSINWQKCNVELKLHRMNFFRSVDLPFISLLTVDQMDGSPFFIFYCDQWLHTTRPSFSWHHWIDNINFRWFNLRLVHSSKLELKSVRIDAKENTTIFFYFYFIYWNIC